MFFKRVLVAFVLGVIGIALFFIGIHVKNNPTIPAEYVGEAKATITELTKSTTTGSDGKKKDTYHVEVSFMVNGTEYGGTLNEYNSSMKKGKEIALIYDTRDPTVYETPGKNKTTAYILMGMGAVFFVMGFVALFARNVRMRSRRGLLRM